SISPPAPSARPPTASTGASASSSATPTSTGSCSEGDVRAQRRVASGILLASLVLAGPGCTDDDAALCDRLAEKPSELTVTHWSNGITGSAATWSATLTDGVLYG